MRTRSPSPGSGGATEIATCCRKTYIVMKQSRRSFVETLDFVTSLGHGPTGTGTRLATRDSHLRPGAAGERPLRHETAT